jgi:hypothetical protein
MPVAQEVNQAWIRQTLADGGYDVTESDDLVLAKHSGRPNLAVSIRPSNGIISFRHLWGTKVEAGSEEEFRNALNTANRSSWYDTYYVDDEGTLIVSFYMPLTESLSERDLLGFLERESMSFQLIVTTTGLAQFVE